MNCYTVLYVTRYNPLFFQDVDAKKESQSYLRISIQRRRYGRRKRFPQTRTSRYRRYPEFASNQSYAGMLFDFPFFFVYSFHCVLIDFMNYQFFFSFQSLKSRDYVKEQFAWRHYYWYLTNEGIQYLRDYLHLPTEVNTRTNII